MREVDNGEIIIVENNEIKSIKPFPNQKSRPCVFEYIYFARPDSLLNNKCAYEYRKNLGVQLAKETDIEADLVCSCSRLRCSSGIRVCRTIKKNLN